MRFQDDAFMQQGLFGVFYSEKMDKVYTYLHVQYIQYTDMVEFGYHTRLNSGGTKGKKEIKQNPLPYS